MRTILFLAATFFAIVALAQPARPAIPRTEWVDLKYFDAKSADYAPVEAQARRDQVLEAFGALAEQKLKRAPPLRIAMQECGQENVLYLAEARAIILCYELVRSQMYAVSAKLKGASQPAISAAIVGAMAFVLFHELGHALPNRPKASRDEDLADQFAAYMILETVPTQAAGMLFGAILTYETGQLSYLRQHYAKGQALDSQHTLKLACWGYGHSPAAFEPLLRYVKMPAERASHCASEYAQIKRRVETVFAAALKRSGQR
jgi:hypothetical protein